jgi:uncharacterized protein
MSLRTLSLTPRKVIRLVLVVLLVLLLGIALIAFRSYRREAASFEPHHYEIPLNAAVGLPDPREVAFEAMTGTIKGWYSRSTNGAAIVLVHGSGADRRAVLGEAVLLASEGYGVLLIDMPGHGESSGHVDWSDGGRSALVAALDFLSIQPDVDPGRLGALGTSMGGFTVAQVAATDERLKAVALLGAPPDQEEVTRWENRRYGPLSEIPALWAMERGGLPRNERPPIDEINKISPRAVLVVGGSNDRLVTPDFTRRLFEAAGQPKDLIMIDKAGHGDYLEAGGDAYRDALLRFFDEYLLDGTSD